MQLFIACLVLTGIHGFFVMSEYSIVRTSGRDRNGGNLPGFSAGLREIHDNLEEYLLVSQIGKTASLLGMGVLLGGLLSDPGSTQLIPVSGLSVSLSNHFILVFMAFGLAHLILGQEIPKHWGITHSEQCAEALCSYMRFSHFMVWPFLWIIKWCSAALAHWRV